MTPDNQTAWRGEICKRCGRRNCVGFSVPDETWTAVVGGRWGVLCTTCFDEEAEVAGVAYTHGEVWPITWSDWALEDAPPATPPKIIHGVIVSRKMSDPPDPVAA